ncbi:uncharacterized protein LOC133815426 [Humulus lupulus]|uniref:uncharacterized protein LOC133815426 n=1 Tax=Humulus lupulus TaxID=3486 RepID=UPI002B40DD35|nr:uncharacterized protein LOC133815426 [Humulus lupulus]
MGVEGKGMKNKRSRSKDLEGRVGKKRQIFYDNSLSPNRIRSKLLLDRARRYRSPMKRLESSSSMFESRTRRCLHSESYCSFCKEYENHVCVDEVDRDVPIPPWSFVIPDEDGDAMTINIPSDVNKGNLQIPDHVKWNEEDFNFCVKLDVHVFVYDLPPQHDSGIDGDVDSEEYMDNMTINFVAASEQSIERLEKVLIKDDQIVCSICFENVHVGLEATKLPCTHTHIMKNVLFSGYKLVNFVQCVDLR